MPPKCKHTPKGKKSRCNLPSGNQWDHVTGVLPLSTCDVSRLKCRETHEIQQLDPIENPKAEKQA